MRAVRLQKAEFLLHGSCGYRACDSGSGNGLRALHASPFFRSGQSIRNDERNVSAFWSTVFGRGESAKRTCPTIYGPRRSLRRPDCGVGSIGTRRKDGANFREGTGWSSKAAIRPGRFSRRSVSIASLRCCTHRRMLRRITR